MLPGLQQDRLPRMADFARVLAAVDQVLGTRGLEAYGRQARGLAADAVDADPVMFAVAAALTQPADLAPCAYRCGRTVVRYGAASDPVCPSCRAAPVTTS